MTAPTLRRRLSGSGARPTSAKYRAQVEASHDSEFVVVDVTTGGWEVDDCECRGDGVAVLAIEVGEKPGNVVLQGVAALGARKQGAKDY